MWMCIVSCCIEWSWCFVALYSFIKSSEICKFFLLFSCLTNVTDDSNFKGHLFRFFLLSFKGHRSKQQQLLARKGNSGERENTVDIPFIQWNWKLYTVHTHTFFPLIMNSSNLLVCWQFSQTHHNVDDIVLYCHLRCPFSTKFPLLSPTNLTHTHPSLFKWYCSCPTITTTVNAPA